MNLENLYILEDRGILYINGNDVTEFLQNLISNDINKVTVENTCFASLLTPQGKYLFDFIRKSHIACFSTCLFERFSPNKMMKSLITI